jgi:hypothetical protein
LSAVLQDEDLPALLAEIAEVAGLKAALAMAEARGGSRVYIPRHPGPGHWLTVAVGAVAARKIADHFAAGSAGIEIELPVGPHGTYVRQQRARRARMHALVKDGVSIDRIAREVGIDRSNVKRFKRKLREDDGQGSLF